MIILFTFILLNIQQTWKDINKINDQYNMWKNILIEMEIQYKKPLIFMPCKIQND